MPVEIRPLTSLRFLLALWVLLFHLRDLLSAEPAVDRLFALGYVAVPGFFLLSGVVLSWTYLGGPAPAIDRRRFFQARAARILPLYLLGFLIALPLFLAKGFAAEVGLLDLLLPSLLVVGLAQSWFPSWALMVNSPAWSLSVEAFFYAVFPAIGAWMIRRSTVVVVGSAVAAVLTSLAVAVVAGMAMTTTVAPMAVQEPGRELATDMARFFPPARLADFVLGICLGVLLIRCHRTVGRWLVVLSIGVGALGLVLLVLVGGSVPFLWANGPLAQLAFACLIFGLAVLPEDHLLHGVLAWRPLLVLGRASFALYILHLPLIDWGWQVAKWLVGPALSGTWFALSMVPLLVAVSLACYHGIEEPLRRRLGGHRRTPPQPPA